MSKTEYFDYLRTAEVLNEHGKFGDKLSEFYREQEGEEVRNKDCPSERNVLGLKFDYTSNATNADYETLKKYAEVGLSGNVNPGYLLARIECHDPRNLDSEPFYLAAVVHLGAVCHEGDMCGDCGDREYDLLGWAISQYGNKRYSGHFKQGRYPHQSSFTWRGKQYFYSVNEAKRIRVADCRIPLDESGGCIIEGLAE